MKILMANDSPAAPYYVRMGQARALTAAGHEVTFWDIKKKCAFDAFNESNPDLFMGQTYNVDRAILKCAAKRPEMKIVLFGSSYGEVCDIDLNRFPIHVATDNEIKIIEQLKPDLIHIHCPDRYRNFVLGNWTNNLGVKTAGIMNGADIFSYLGGKPKQEYVCDVAFVGGFWGYKGVNIRRLLLPLCYENKHSVKIFGNAHWNLAQYLGPIEEENVRHLFASATVCPNISEPHSIEFGYDIVERVFKVPLSGFLVSDNVSGIATDVFKDGECPFFHSEKELSELVDFYTWQSSQMMVNEFQSQQKRTILKSHTYFHRMGDMFSQIGMGGEALNMLTSYDKTMEAIYARIPN